MDLNDPNGQVTALIDRYVSMWNEPDADERCRAIHELWADDGRHVLEAPEDMRSAAKALGFPTLVLEVCGHAALEFRVTTAFNEFIAPGQYRFRSRGNGARLCDLIKFNWEMIVVASGDVAAVGTEIFQLDSTGKISADYQFIEN